MSEHTVQRLREWGESLEREHKGGLGTSLLEYADGWEKQLAERDAALARCVEALQKASYALFQIKRMVPEAIKDHAIKTSDAACEVLNNLPASAQATAKVLAECRWTPDLYGVWETGCGEAFVLNDGTPKQNGMVFCPYCGKAISEEKETK